MHMKTHAYFLAGGLDGGMFFVVVGVVVVVIIIAFVFDSFPLVVLFSLDFVMFLRL